jgi:hypothetical protein
MSVVLGTLPFLATLWLLVVLGAAVLEESGAKIAAALKGEPTRQPAPPARRIRIRMSAASTRISVGNEELRAAA